MARRLSEKAFDHNGRETKSHLVKHAIEKCHKYPKKEGFNVFSKAHRNNTFKRSCSKSC